MRYFKQFVEQIPIPKLTAKNRKLANQIEACVTKILATKSTNPAADTTILEAQIDQIIYRLYGLGSAEIELIEH